MVASRWSEFLDGSSELPEQKFQEPVSGSYCHLKTGSGNRCGTTSTMCYWSCNHRTGVDRERECRWHLWMEKVSKTSWPSLIYEKYHLFHFDSRGQWKDFWADIWDTWELVSAFLLAHRVNLRESLYNPKPYSFLGDGWVQWFSKCGPWPSNINFTWKMC